MVGHPILPRADGCAVIDRDEHGRYGASCARPPVWRGRWRYDHPRRVVAVLLCDLHRGDLVDSDRLSDLEPV